jgi:hypothetical protein
MRTLPKALDRIYAILGVADILKPVLDPLITSIDKLSQAPV